MYVGTSKRKNTLADLAQIECIKRDIGHLCSKDERHPRAKRAKTTNANSAKALVMPEDS